MADRKFGDLRIDQEKAERILSAPLPDTYGNVSLKAITAILPGLREGLRYDEACARAGLHHSARRSEGSLRDSLPYYGEILETYVLPPSSGDGDPANPEERYGRIPNPTVHIALNQLRRVVNALIEKYGPPETIRIELARDLPASGRERKEIEARLKRNRSANEAFREEIRKAGQKPNFDNMEKMKLWSELQALGVAHPCPFTGKAISMNQLFSDAIEVEHLLPFSRTFDDSLGNKTVCYREANREKGNLTPFEAFGGDSDRWAQILSRAQCLLENKRWRFQENAMARFLKEQPDLIARTLNDTRYMSRVAREYLYAVSARVDVIRGGFTWLLRRRWGLNTLLSAGNTKDRGDHRHHAIDAFAIACATPALLQHLQKEIAVQKERHPEVNALTALKLTDFPQPYAGFQRAELEKRVATLVVSHRYDAFSSKSHPPGQLHEETYFGISNEDAKGDSRRIAIRKSVDDLKQDRIADIVDGELRKEFEKGLGLSAAEWKEFVAYKKRELGVRKVRVEENRMLDSLVRLDDGKRWAKSGANAYADIVLINSSTPKKAIFEVVPLSKACRKNFRPEWQDSPTAKKVARLSRNDTVAVRASDGKWRLFRVQKFKAGENRIYLVGLNDAKPPNNGRYLTRAEVAQGCFFKVSVGPIGDLRAPKEVLTNLANGTVSGH